MTVHLQDRHTDDTAMPRHPVNAHARGLRLAVPALRLAGAALAALALQACTWVEVDEAGARVAQRTAAEVAGCRNLGQASVHTTDKVVLARDTRTVQAEVIALAKNQAGAMGGNAIVPAGPLNGGSQSFDVYRCE